MLRASDKDGKALYKNLIYSGQLDVIIGAALTERFLPTVQWAGAEELKTTKKSVWRVHPSDVEVAGYARQVGTFSHVIVRNAGHIVPGDQPERALDMIWRFVEGRSYENLPNPTSGSPTPTCLHNVDTVDHKCFEACSLKGLHFASKGLTTAGGCPASYNFVEKVKAVTQCPDGVTNLRYCASTKLKVTMKTKGEAK